MSTQFLPSTEVEASLKHHIGHLEKTIKNLNEANAIKGEELNTGITCLDALVDLAEMMQAYYPFKGHTKFWQAVQTLALFQKNKRDLMAIQGYCDSVKLLSLGEWKGMGRAIENASYLFYSCQKAAQNVLELLPANITEPRTAETQNGPAGPNTHVVLLPPAEQSQE